MPTLGFHRDFLKDFAGLERNVVPRVLEAIDKFEHSSSTGQHLEKLNHGRDPRLKTIRITKFYRGVVLAPASGDSFLLLKVLPHDDAINWALTHRISVNAATQGVEIRNDVAIERLTDGLGQARSDVVATDGIPLFAHVSDADLGRLGIDESVLRLARRLASEALLDSVRPFLPEHQYDVLCGLAAGMPVEQVWQEIVQTQLAAGREAEAHAEETHGRPMDELTGAMARAQGRIALVSGPKELMELLERPFDAWRIFLHPSQRRVAYRPSHSGPVRVTGGPGTGKTVVALHRAAHLAARLPADAPDGCILLTTYNRTLAVELERCLDLLVTDPVRRLRIRVVNVDALAYELVCNHLGVAKLNILQDQREILTRWARVVRQHGLPFADTFLDQEWRHVVLAQDLQREQDYLLASRSGRGTALGTLQRTQVWRAVEAFQQELRRDGLWTFLEVCAMAARLLDGHAGMGGSRPFRHVIVDEAQDLHPCQWRLLRAAVPAGADDLFATGDSHQRIYGNTVSLMSLGIPVTGRSYRLHVNYRSTQEIVSWAVALMVTQGPGTGTGPDGDEESLTGYYSAFSGAGPVVEGYPSKSAELAALVAAVGEWIAAGVPAEDIGVAIRFVQLGRDVTTALTAAGIPAAFLSSAAPTPEQGKGVQIGTMHRMKGLEYRCMAVVGVNDGVVPMRNAVTPLDADPQQHREDLLTELNLLFVAVTRPREALRVTWHGRPSTFLAPQ